MDMKKAEMIGEKCSRIKSMESLVDMLDSPCDSISFGHSVHITKSSCGGFFLQKYRQAIRNIMIDNVNQLRMELNQE